MNIAALNASPITVILYYVTEFAKRIFTHTSNLPTLTIHNFRLKAVIALKFGQQ